MELLRRRGELDGVRLLGPRTVDYLASNHLPGGADLHEFGNPVTSDEAPAGVGFGLGVSVTIDPVTAKVPSGAGEYGWSGAATTGFFGSGVVAGARASVGSAEGGSGPASSGAGAAAGSGSAGAMAGPSPKQGAWKARWA